MQPESQFIGWLKACGLAAAILLFSAGVGEAVQILNRQQALIDFVGKLQAAQSANLSGNFVFTGRDFLSIYNSDVRFDAAYRQGPGQPLDSAAKFYGKFATKSYDGQALTHLGELYFNLAGADLPVIRYKQSQQLYQIQPQWYKSRIDRSLYDYACQSHAQVEQSATLRLYGLLSNVHPGQARMVAKEKLDGHDVTHYVGSVAPGNFPDLAKQFYNQLPPDCSPPFGPSDLKDVKLDYDLWTSPDFDRIKFSLDDKVLHANGYLQADISNYNGPVDIPTPPPAIDLHQLLEAQK